MEKLEKLTPVENLAKDRLETRFDQVLRCTPNAVERFAEEHPKLADEVSKRAEEEGIELGGVFRAGVPDFLGVQQTGEYLFVEVKGEGDGLRHSQLKWFREFGELECEVWFVDSNEGVTERMESERLDAYSLKDSAGEGHEVLEYDGELVVEIPRSLAASLGVEEGDEVDWSVVDASSLRLDT